MPKIYVIICCGVIAQYRAKNLPKDAKKIVCKINLAAPLTKPSCLNESPKHETLLIPVRDTTQFYKCTLVTYILLITISKFLTITKRGEHEINHALNRLKGKKWKHIIIGRRFQCS